MIDGIVCAFQGRMGGDAETRFLPNGSEVLQFSVMPADSKVADGAAEWVRVSVFAEKMDERTAAQLSKGALVYIEGKLQLGRWRGQDGAERAGLRVNAWIIQPMGQIGYRGRSQRLLATDRVQVVSS